MAKKTFRKKLGSIKDAQYDLNLINAFLEKLAKQLNKVRWSAVPRKRKGGPTDTPPTIPKWPP